MADETYYIDEPYHIFEKTTHTTRFLLGAEDDVDTVDDVDVSVHLPDGSTWMASLMTTDSIARVLRKWSLTGEYLGGIFFRGRDLVIPREPGLPAALRMIDNLVDGSDGRLQDVFEEYEAGDEEGTYESVATPTPPVPPSEHPHVVTGDGYTATFMLDTTDDPDTVTDVGAVLELTDGTRWAARYMTLDAVRDALRDRDYFHDWNLVIIASPGIPAIIDLIDQQTTSDEEPVRFNYRPLT